MANYIFDKELENYLNPLASFRLASNNGDYNTNTLSNDVLVTTKYSSQNIHLGSMNNRDSVLKITSSNVNINGGLQIATCNNFPFYGLQLTNSNAESDALTEINLNNDIGKFKLQLYSSLNNSNQGHIVNEIGDILIKPKGNVPSMYFKKDSGYIGINNFNPFSMFHLTDTASNLNENGQFIVEKENSRNIGGTINLKNNAILQKGNKSSLAFQLHKNRKPFLSDLLSSHANISAELENSTSDDTSLIFSLQANEKMRLNSLGYVGIGVSNPIANLHLKNTNENSGILFIGDNNNMGGFLSKDVNGNIDINIGELNNSSTLLRISNSSKNVGIGNISPKEKLDVNGNILSSRIYNKLDGSASLPTYSWNNHKNSGMYLENGSTKFSINSNEIFAISGTHAKLNKSLYVYDSILSDKQFIGMKGTNKNSTGTVFPTYSWSNSETSGMYLPGSNEIAFSTTGIQRFRIFDNGNISLSSNSVYNYNDKLNVEGNIRLDGNFVKNGSLQVFSSDFTVKENLYAEKKIGVGTKLPTKLLHVNGDAFFRSNITVSSFINANQFKITSMDSSNSPGFTWDNEQNTGIFKPNSGVIALSLTGNEKMRINDIGIGINIDNPQYPLDVHGDIYSSHNITAQNRGLIGQNPPSSGKLSVDGDTHVRFDIESLQANIIGNRILSKDSHDESHPGFTFAGNVTAGMYNPGPNKIGLVTNQNERISIIDSGMVGINNKSPSHQLHIIGTTATDDILSNRFNLNQSDSELLPGFTWNFDQNTGIYHPASHQVSITLQGVERYRFSNAGLGIFTKSPQHALDVHGDVYTSQNAYVKNNCFIGTNPPNGTLAVDGNINAILDIESIQGNITGNRLYAKQTNYENFPCFTFEGDNDTGIYHPGSNTIGFVTAGTEKLTILDNGNVGVKTKNPSADLEVYGDILAYTFNNISDRNMKTNIEKINEPMRLLENINGYSFNYKEGYNLDKRRKMGVIAQEVEEILPEMVKEFNGIKSVNYENFIPILIESIKYLNKRVDCLEQNKKYS